MSHLPVSGEQPVVPLPEREPVAIRAAVARLNPGALARFEADWTAATARARDEYSGFVTFDGAEIHLGVEPDLDTRVDRRSTAYLFVEDADALAETWLAAGGDVRLPQDTEWGQHEGVLVDPDGNVIRFGSPMSADPGRG
jgi:hypothetical protein